MSKLPEEVNNSEDLAKQTLGIIATADPETFNNAKERFDTYTEVEERVRQLKIAAKRMKEVPKPQGVVADTTAQATAMKTFVMINEKLQQNIAEGVEPTSNDIKLMIEMLKAFNGDK